MSFIALFIYDKAQKFFANRAGAVTNFSLWKAPKIKFIFFKKKSFYIPLWLVIPIIISFLSKGQIFFAALTTTSIIVKPAYRLGRKYINLTEFEHAKIAVSGPITLILISLILNPIDFQIINDFTLVTTMIAVFSLLPLPNLDGSTVFFSSKPLYIFNLVFALSIAILLKFLTTTYALVLALLAAIFATSYYLYKYFTKK